MRRRTTRKALSHSAGLGAMMTDANQPFAKRRLVLFSSNERTPFLSPPPDRRSQDFAELKINNVGVNLLREQLPSHSTWSADPTYINAGSTVRRHHDPDSTSFEEKECDEFEPFAPFSWQLEHRSKVGDRGFAFSLCCFSARRPPAGPQPPPSTVLGTP